MQGKDFIYFLFDENNNSYYAYGDTVLLSGSLKPLEFTPDGWTKIQLQNQRNPTYFAVDRSFSVPLDYLKDGGQILKYIYYNFGVEAKVYMAICEQKLFFDATHYGFYYSLLYRGEIDLANFKHDGPKVTVNIMEGGLVKLIKAYENTKYEIPVNVPQAIDIMAEGIELTKKGSFSLANDVDIRKSVFSASWFMPVIHINDDGEAAGILFQSQELEALFSTPFDTKKNSANLLADTFSGNTSPIACEITGTINFECTVHAPGLGFRARFITSTQTIANQSIYEIFSVGPITGNTYTFDFSLTINLQPDEKLKLEAIYFGPTGALDIGVKFLEGSAFSVTYKSKYKPTSFKALRPLYVFQQLISKISNGQYTPQSTFLQSIQDVVITCGDAIRRIPGSVIKTSLRDFFSSYNSDFGIGMGMIGNVLRIEEKAFWIDYTDPIDLGEVSKMKVSPATDLLINNIKNGSPNQTYDDVNGKQEFNTTQERSAPITRIAKDLNLVSVYRKDCYGIEFTRINLDGKTTTDDKGDNDVFMIHVEDNPQPDGFYHFDRSLNAGAAGLLTPSTVFNLYLTPARGIRRNGNYIRSLFYKLESKYLTFQTADKNKDVIAGGITEKADIQIASLDPALFSCNYLEFETKVPVNLFDILSVSPLKAFTGTWAGFSFVGIVDKISMQPGDNAAQTFKLLPSPTTDLTQLITIDG